MALQALAFLGLAYALLPRSSQRISANLGSGDVQAPRLSFGCWVNFAMNFSYLQ